MVPNCRQSARGIAAGWFRTYLAKNIQQNRSSVAARACDTTRAVREGTEQIPAPAAGVNKPQMQKHAAVFLRKRRCRLLVAETIAPASGKERDREMPSPS